MVTVAPAVTLYHVGLVRRIERRRSAQDRRRWVSYEIHTFRGSDGAEYRKSFELRVGARLAVPRSGTHATYDALAYQGTPLARAR